MLSVLLRPTYRSLFTAHVFALLGTGLATIALGFLAFDVGGADAGVVLGTLFAIKMLAYLIIAPLAAALLVRADVRRVLIVCDIVRVLCALALPFVTEAVQAYALVIVLQCASAVFTPAFQATIPTVLPEERDYTNALALSRLAYDLELLVSPALAGLLLLFFPSSGLFFGTAVGFAASVLLLFTVRLPKAAVNPDRESAGFADRLTRGARLMFASPPLRGVLALQLTVAAVGAFVFVQTVVLVRGTLAQPEWYVTVVLGAFGAGSMCSALAMPRLIERLGERRFMLIGAALITVPLPFVAAVVAAPIEIASVAVIGLWAVMGFGYSGVLAPTGRVIRSNIPAAELPAVFAAQFSLAHGWWLFCYPLAGWLGAAFGLGTAAVVLAGVAVLATAAAFVLWKPVPVPVMV